MEVQTANPVIIQSWEEPLNEGDRGVLRNLRNRKLYYFIVLPYLVILLTIFVAVMEGLSGTSVTGVKFNVELVSRVLPVFIPLSLILATVFFYRYFRQTAFRLIKDLKLDKKVIIQFPCTKYEMAFFNKYYVKTPLESKQVVQVSKETFLSLEPTETLFFEYAPHSSTIFVLRDGERVLEYF